MALSVESAGSHIGEERNEVGGDLRARGRVGRICHWHGGGSVADDGPPEFLFALDADGRRWPATGYFTIPPTAPRAESLVRLVRTAAEHGWLVGAAGKPRPGTQMYDVYDLYTEL